MSPVAQIWKVGPKEVPEAMELIKESFTYNEVETYDLLKEKARSERELLLLAKLGGKAIGMLEAEIQERTSIMGRKHIGVIYTVLVREEHRNKGVGRQLIDTAIIWFRVNGVTEAVAGVSENDTAGKEFFGRLEFKPYQIRMQREIEPFEN